jgi:hypothetical protein
MGNETKHETCTIALVRDIHQRGYYKEILNPIIRPDGWILDQNHREWFSPTNVLSVTTFIPQKWDGNDLKPGTICNLDIWRGATSERTTGYETVPVVVIGRSAKNKAYEVLMPDGSKGVVGERKLVPLMDEPDAQE